MTPLSVITLGLMLAAPAPQNIGWKKQVLDTRFRTEGVGVADVNKDGKLDVLNGEFWYEGPDFTKAHEMQKPGDYGDGIKGYSHSFAVFPDDFNGDGWTDAIVIDFPGVPCFWLENPQGKEGHWKKHIIWHSACNETPLYKDLLGNGKKVLIMGYQPKGSKPDSNEGSMAYFTPGKDPTALWEMHPISETGTPSKVIPGTARFSHGLGTGDINGDGRLDVIVTGTNSKGVAAWWEQPEKPDGKSPWKQHAFNFGDACADMHVADLDGDGKADILCTSAHRFGIWQLKQRPDPNGGSPAFTKTDLFPELLSETHAAHYVDIDGDGLKDLVTGKRFWSHGRNEKGADAPAMIYWFQAKKGSDGAITFTPREIDNDSGIGTQFEVADIDGDGLLDVISSNKKGVRVIRQVRK